MWGFEGVNERIDEDVLRWFSHVERLENDKIAKRVCVGECASSRSVGRPRKRWINTVKDRQVGRMVQDRCEWRGLRGGMHGT